VAFLRRTIPPLAAGLALAACATPPNENLIRAEHEVQGAAADPLVVEHAPLLVEDAQRAAERARRAHRDGAPREEVDSLAYVASRRAEIARLSAQREADVERAEALRAQGGPTLLAPRLGPVVRLEEVLFDRGRETPRAHEYADLERAAEWMLEHPSHQVRVEGHADETEADPVSLSSERANRIASELVRLGVAPERLQVRALGDASPVASSATPSGRELNSRVEILAEPVVSSR